MKKNRLMAAVLGAGLFFVSCASNRIEKPTTSPVYVTNTKKIYILNPSQIEKTLDGQQILVGAFGDQKFTLQAYVFANENCIEIGLFNDFGTDMGMLTFDGVTALCDSALFPPQLKAEYILNDFQNAYYKPESIRENLAASKLDFTVETSNGVETRKVLSNGKVVEEIIISDGEVTIKNILRGYEFQLFSAE